jgi:signal transduction histidine kinase
MVIENEGLLDLLAEVKASPAQALFHEIEIRQLGTGRAAVFQALAAPLMVGEGLQGIATVLRDVTTQKELERMKSNFLSVVSHELKTPLHSVKGFVDIILMGKTGPVTEIQRDFLETVKQQTDHLQRMIDDLLEFSRLESGRVSLRLQLTDIPVVVEAVIDKLTPLAASAEVVLVNHVSEDLPTFLADPWRLEQVVTNLVDNAIKFTPVGGTVTITASSTGEFIQVNVQDTGIGVPMSESERIFDRFYQVDGGVNRLYKGTGLGLTICRHIVEHHGGRIWVQSAQEKGAIFAFTVSRHLQAGDVGALDFTTLPQEKLLDN